MVILETYPNTNLTDKKSSAPLTYPLPLHTIHTLRALRCCHLSSRKKVQIISNTKTLTKFTYLHRGFATSGTSTAGGSAEGEVFFKGLFISRRTLKRIKGDRVNRITKLFLLILFLLYALHTSCALALSNEFIALVMKDDTKQDEIFILNIKETSIVQYTKHRLRPRELVLSPNRRYIAFVGNSKPVVTIDSESLYLLDLNNKEVIKLTDFRLPAGKGGWSQDSEKLYWVMEGYQTRVLEFHQNKLFKDEAQEIKFQFQPFPDKHVEFQFFGGQDRFDYEIVLVEHGKQHRLTTNKVRDAYPTLSPDGGKIAFISEQKNIPQVVVMEENGTQVQTITNFTTNKFPRMLAWAPVIAWYIENQADTKDIEAVQVTEPTKFETPSKTTEQYPKQQKTELNIHASKTIENNYSQEDPKIVTYSNKKIEEPMKILQKDNGCKIEIISDPPRSSVTIDRVIRGNTPLVLNNITPGTHLIRIAAGEHYKPVVRSIYLSKGETAKLNITLPMTTDRSFTLGSAAFAKGNLGEASRLFQYAITELPRKPEAFFYLGILARDHGNLDEAAAYFKNFINFKPEILDSYYYLGEIYNTQELWANTVTHFKRFLLGIPKFQEITKHQPPITDAFKIHLERLLEKEPNNQEARFQFALLLEQKGKLSESTKELIKIFEQFPINFPGAKENLFFKDISQLNLSILSHPIPNFLLPSHSN